MYRNTKLRVGMILLLVFGFFASGLNLTAASAAENQATVSVVDQYGKILFPETTVTIATNENAFDALVGAVGEENVEYTQYSFGKWIDSILGLAGTADFTKYWGFFINGESAATGADGYIVQAGDKLTFQYTDTTAVKQATLSVIGVNGAVLYPKTNIAIADNENGFDALVAAVGEENVGYTQYSFGKWIDSILGLAGTADFAKYWGFYINGESATTGADGYTVQNGDQLTFQYTDTTAAAGDGTPTNDDSSNTETNNPISNEQLQTAMDQASQYTLSNWDDTNTWGAVALRQAGKTVPDSYLETAKQLIQSKGGNFRLITDAEKYTMGILAAGGDPANIAGYNLVEKIYNGDVTKQGNNGVVYALIALDSGNFTIPSSAVWTREKLIQQLLDVQQSDGHWSLSATDSSTDIDVTAMVLTALASYKDQEGVKDSITKAVDYLSTQYLSGKVDNSNSAAQVVIALSALGIDANDLLFTKDNVSIMQYLMSFQNADGGFGYKPGDASETMSTPQGLLAVGAYQRFMNGKGSIYQLPVNSPVSNETATNDGQTTAQTQTQTQTQAQAQTQTQVQTQTQAQTETQAGSQEGSTLPKTATNTWNLLAAGMLLVIGGLVVLYFTRRRNA